MQITSSEKIGLFFITYQNTMSRSCQQRGNVIYLTPLTDQSRLFFN